MKYGIILSLCLFMGCVDPNQPNPQPRHNTVTVDQDDDSTGLKIGPRVSIGPRYKFGEGFKIGPSLDVGPSLDF